MRLYILFTKALAGTCTSNEVSFVYLLLVVSRPLVAK